MKAVKWLPGILTAGLILLGTSLVLKRPAPDAGEAGVYSNDCCGTVSVSHGRMQLNGQLTVRYSVGRDADGPYLMPHTYVGVVDNEGFDVDGTQAVRKLRLDRLPSPRRILLYEGREPYAFSRRPSYSVQR
jgi:hypothetical protein